MVAPVQRVGVYVRIGLVAVPDPFSQLRSEHQVRRSVDHNVRWFRLKGQATLPTTREAFADAQGDIIPTGRSELESQSGHLRPS